MREDYMQELIKAYNENRIIVSPCKFGTILYRPAINKRHAKQCHKINKNSGYIKQIKLTNDNFAKYVLNGEIGKSVFMSQEEAQEQLEKMICEDVQNDLERMGRMEETR